MVIIQPSAISYQLEEMIAQPTQTLEKLRGFSEQPLRITVRGFALKSGLADG